MEITTEAVRTRSDEELQAALAETKLAIQRLEEHARGRHDPSEWYERGVGEAILEGLQRRRHARDKMEQEILARKPPDPKREK